MGGKGNLKNDSLTNCIFIKAILMILVILYHSCVFWTGNWWKSSPIISSDSVRYFAMWLNSFHIYAFTLVSGYIFAYKVCGGAYKYFLPFIKNKVKRLLIPYLFVVLIWIIPIARLLFNIDFTNIYKSYIICTNPDQLWFLWMLFFVFIIVWPLKDIMIHKPKFGWLISLTFFGIGIIGKKYLINVYCIWTAFEYVLFFFVGIRVRINEEKGKKISLRNIQWYVWLIVNLILFIISLIISSQSGIVFSLLRVLLSICLRFSGAIMAWTALQVVASKINWKDSRVFHKFSIYSMPMYLFHQQIIYFTIILFDGKISPWIHVSVNFFFALIISFFISEIMMKCKITRFLIGEK